MKLDLIDWSFMKENIARSAVKLIKNNMIVGLGGGETVALIAELIANETGKDIRIVTLSEETKKVCKFWKLPLVELSDVKEIDLTFDGCDLVDQNFQALKTKGGIQTQEKITAAMSKRYVLLATTAKYQKVLHFKLPICCEIIPEALPVLEKLVKAEQGTVTLRMEKGIPIITKYNNYLADVTWNSRDSVFEISKKLDQTIGVISHSLFLSEITDILLANPESKNVKHLRKYFEGEKKYVNI